MIRHVVLVGLSGTGKSTVARHVAEALGWDLVDTDALIEQRTGRSIPEIFRDDGEAAFRAVEAGVLRESLAGERRVVATGGGAVIDPSAWAADLLGHPSTLVVWLDAHPVTLVERLQAQAEAEGNKANRPLLEGDPLARITAMREQRSPMYGRSAVVLPVDVRPADGVAADIAEMVRLASGEESSVDLRVESAASTIRVSVGSRLRLGELVAARWPRARAVWLVVDANLQPHAGDLLEALRASVGRPVHVRAVPAGEGSKSLSGVSDLYDWMLGGGVERGDVAIALGGGVVGDLTGFAAATVLRGIGLVQVPTTLLSMVDSSVGGKTGINHPAGKNLIGAFYQPPEVVIDPALLASLPGRELRSGWAEIIKHGLIEPSTPGGTPPVLREVLARNAVALSRGDQPLLSWLIRRNVSLKAAVVAADEREAGLRAILNLGHTVGHGVEAASYNLLHGEAVAVGLRAASRIATGLELVDASFEEDVVRMLEGYGLPVSARVEPDAVRARMASDKKKSGGRQTWVMPVREGGVRLVSDVPGSLVDEAIEAVTR